MATVSERAKSVAKNIDDACVYADRVEELENLLREIDDVPYMVIPDGCGNGKPCDSCVKVVAIVNRALAQEEE